MVQQESAKIGAMGRLNVAQLIDIGVYMRLLRAACNSHSVPPVEHTMTLRDDPINTDCVFISTDSFIFWDLPLFSDNGTSQLPSKAKLNHPILYS